METTWFFSGSPYWSDGNTKATLETDGYFLHFRPFDPDNDDYFADVRQCGSNCVTDVTYLYYDHVYLGQGN
jgi:hypothetical protein